MTDAFGRGSVPFDRIANRYDETRGGRERGQRAASAISRWLPADGPLLEIGVGTGVVAVAVERPVLGVDLSAAMLARAHQRLGPRVVRADAQQLPVADASVAAAYFVHVLHLVGDIAGALAEAYRVIRPGGRLLAVCGGSRRRPMMLTTCWRH